METSGTITARAFANAYLQLQRTEDVEFDDERVQALKEAITMVQNIDFCSLQLSLLFLTKGGAVRRLPAETRAVLADREGGRLHQPQRGHQEHDRVEKKNHVRLFSYRQISGVQPRNRQIRKGTLSMKS